MALEKNEKERNALWDLFVSLLSGDVISREAFEKGK
jgi:hypothetical protein